MKYVKNCVVKLADEKDVEVENFIYAGDDSNMFGEVSYDEEIFEVRIAHNNTHCWLQRRVDA